MNAKTLLLIVGLLVLMIGVGGAGWVVNHLWGSPSSYTPENDESRTDSEGVVCTGYVDLEHGIRSLAPLRPGRVARILAVENSHVEAGTPILRLEDRAAQFQVEEAEAALTSAEIQLKEASKLELSHPHRIAQQQAAVDAAGFRLDAARQVLRRKESQAKDDLVVAIEVSTARDEVKALDAAARAEREKLAELRTVDPSLSVGKARANVRLAQTRRDQARHQLDECTLKAPSEGTIQRIAVGAGDVVTGTSQLPLVRFCPDEKPLVRAEVNQEFADRIKVGQKALLRDDTHSGASWNGHVQRVADWFERRRPTTQDPAAYTDVRTAECLIALDPDQPPLRIGQRMRVIIGNVPKTGGE